MRFTVRVFETIETILEIEAPTESFAEKLGVRFVLDEAAAPGVEFVDSQTTQVTCVAAPVGARTDH